MPAGIQCGQPLLHQQDAAEAGGACRQAAGRSENRWRGDHARNGYAGRNRVFPEPYDQKRSEEHTSELQSLMRISYAVFCLKKKNKTTTQANTTITTDPTTTHKDKTSHICHAQLRIRY